MNILNFYNLIFIQFIILFVNFVSCSDKESFLVVSVATEETGGYLRFIRSLKKYDYNYEIYGLGEKWIGGDMKIGAGGGQKINILLRELKKYKNDAKKIILFTDSYDVVVTQTPKEILNKFKSSGANILFGAEGFCWPDRSLEDLYPVVGSNEKRFLNSGGIIGYADYLYDMISTADLKDDDDDQYFYTKIFMDTSLRKKFNIKLDTKSEIFQNLNGAINELTLIPNGDDYNIYNNLTGTIPSIIHANGPSKKALNRLGNYIGRAYSVSDGCITCKEDVLDFDLSDDDQWPEVTIGLFIEGGTPFLNEFLTKFSKLNYPKSKMSLLIHNKIKSHTKEIKNFETQNGYKTVEYLTGKEEKDGRLQALNECMKNQCEYYFSLDSIVHFNNPDTLKILIKQNRSIISPAMSRQKSFWSNFWGDVDNKGYYVRSPDYFEIVEKKKTGLWNVPHISAAILMKPAIFKNIAVTYEHSYLDPSLAFTALLRENDIFMFTLNTQDFGYLINPESFNSNSIRPELYELANNFEDWETRYLHKEYYNYLISPDLTEPCRDVFKIPFLSEKACDDILAVVEENGKWASKTDDPILEEKKFDNLPKSIEFKQIDFQKQWTEIVQKFITPFTKKFYVGSYSSEPSVPISLVTRYEPGDDDHTRPHDDSAVYLLYLALNEPQIDFEMGGIRFMRFNCSVTDLKKGWALIFPSVITHYFENIPVKSGTRYTLTSYIDS